MSYRKITVDGVQYKYVIGRHFVKIVGGGIYKVEDVGNPTTDADKFVVSPGNIKSLIQGKNPVKTFNCDRHGTSTTQLTASPYGSEVYGKIRLMQNCRECVQEDAFNI